MKTNRRGFFKVATAAMAATVGVAVAVNAELRDKYDEAEESEDWERLGLEEFLSGYADIDAVYDKCQSLDELPNWPGQRM